VSDSIKIDELDVGAFPRGRREIGVKAGAPKEEQSG
jgi:hypothetical protein